MKKSSVVKLVLITALLASCHKHTKKKETEYYLRSDQSAQYTPVMYYPGNPYFMWYYAFRPYGMIYGGGGYQHAGYYSGAISESSNIGTSGMKGGIARGGFGGSHGFSVSS